MSLRSDCTMALKWTFLLWNVTFIISAIALNADAFQQRCLSFNPESLVNNSTRTILEYLATDTKLDLPENDASCGRMSQLISVDTCRVALSILTSNRSSITFELWMPRDWTGRFLGTGNGGIDGCVKYEDLAYASSNGFASVGSNNGHNGTSGIAFFQNLEVVTDFAWRARRLHISARTGKDLVENFYDRPHSKSYYLGCSLGGAQGIKAAQDFPGDFDGIVAGAPALDFNNLSSWRASFFPITGTINSTDFISPLKWTSLIHPEILKQCDELDGVVDGIIENPDLCEFRPESLLCLDANRNEDCLTSIQVEKVRKIFSPLESSDGSLIYPAMQPGSEIMAVNKLYAGSPFSYSEDWFRYVVYSDLSWNPSTFTTLDAVAADKLNPANIRTWPTSHDLAQYRRTGGKIISYHGGQDNQITSFESERFYWRLRDGLYSYVSADIKKENGSQPIGVFHSDDASLEALDMFFRLFRVPGMFHCNSGPGAWVLGQGGGAPAAGIPFVPEQNVLAALVAWVEHGRVPETIGGTKFVDDDSQRGIAMERLHCRYPFRNTYIGGNSTLSSSWICS